eukprot:1176797-Prorocentrum_minimum.AAC.4
MRKAVLGHHATVLVRPSTDVHACPRNITTSIANKNPVLLCDANKNPVALCPMRCSFPTRVLSATLEASPDCTTMPLDANSAPFDALMYLDYHSSD